MTNIETIIDMFDRYGAETAKHHGFDRYRRHMHVEEYDGSLYGLFHTADGSVMVYENATDFPKLYATAWHRDGSMYECAYDPLEPNGFRFVH